MNDFLKELNIIDILGIGVPGCLLVLLLGGDQTASLLWTVQFQGNPLALGILLIVAGSIVGMLIQELGDMIEKGLWLIPWLDPKVYAACAVNIDSIDKTEMDKHKYPVPTGGTAKALKLVCGLTALGVVLCASLVFPVSMWHAAHAANNTVWMDWPAWLGLFPLILTAAAACRYKKVLPQKSQDDQEKIKAICLANPYIQTRLVNHGNASKRTLYDGWRFVMRNLILVFAITNLVCLWKPLGFYRQIAENMVGVNGNMTGNMFGLTFIVSIAISLMLVRYFHYAFLRYKYSLEDFIAL